MKFKKMPLYAAIFLFVSCGGGGNPGESSSPAPDIQQAADVYANDQLATADGTTDTGSTETTIIEVAQYNKHPRYNRFMPPPVVVSLKGENSTQTIDLAIIEPPGDINACLDSVVTNTIPIAESEHQYNTWWLIATPTKLFYKPEKYEVEDGQEPKPIDENKIIFYWAKQISEDEVVVISSSAETPITIDKAKNVKINTGFTTLPYMFVNRLEIYGSIPKDRNDKCLG